MSRVVVINHLTLAGVADLRARADADVVVMGSHEPATRGSTGGMP